MAYSTTHLYPEDLYGTNPQNLISNEPHTLQAPGPKDYYFIIPQAAPFFVDSLVVINTATNLPYVEGDDYQIGHLFIEAMDSTGRPIAGSIRFMRPTIVGQVKLTYRTLGGPWGFSDQAILRELSNKHLNPLIRSWGDIDVLPYAFPPLPHDQRVDSLIGSKEINETLEKIAEILEASAAGTSLSHINDHNNPHQTDAKQVGLGNVPNFKMATDQEHLDATRNDLFTNPRGVLLEINKYAVTPLQNHIDATGNVHGLVPADIGLGNVPNWKPATPTEAIDPTNTTTFMNPYTTSLLVQKLANDPRLDQLILDFNAHITANNPHGITPQLIGTYSAQQIDQMIASVSQGGDAVTFGGETVDEWEDKFPSVADINEILDQLFSVYVTALQGLNELDVENPITPEDISRRQSMRCAWAFGEWDAYAVYNSIGDGRIITSIELAGAFPDEPMAEIAGRWATAEKASYYIEPDGSINAWGDNAVVIPTSLATGPGFNPAVKAISLHPYKNNLAVYLSDNRIIRIDKLGNRVDIAIIEDVISYYGNNGTIDPRHYGVVEYGNLEDTSVWRAIGDPGFVAAFGTVTARVASGSWLLEDLRIGSEYLNVLVTKRDEDGNITDSRIWIYKINHGGTITISDVTNTTRLFNHTTEEYVFANTVTNATTVAGSFNHFLFTSPIGPDTELCDLLSFGDDSSGQLEITARSAPFVAVAAGNNFTVTINQFHFAEFWGDSPNNALVWPDGKYIEVDEPPVTP